MPSLKLVTLETKKSLQTAEKVRQVSVEDTKRNKFFIYALPKGGIKITRWGGQSVTLQ